MASQLQPVSAIARPRPRSSAKVKLTAEQVAQLALDAGLSADNAAHAVAIAQRESSFQTDAHNTVPPDDSVGLWQINYYGDLRVPRTAAFGTPDQLIADPRRQAAAMAVVSNNGTNWGPWTTERGLTQANIDAGIAAVRNVLAGGRVDVPTGPVGPVGPAQPDGSVSPSPSTGQPGYRADTPSTVELPGGTLGAFAWLIVGIILVVIGIYITFKGATIVNVSTAAAGA